MTISGRGTVCTGRVERGLLRPQEQVEIVGLTADDGAPRRVVVTGIQAFRRDLPQAEDMRREAEHLCRTLTRLEPIDADIRKLQAASTQMSALLYLHHKVEDDRDVANALRDCTSSTRATLSARST